MIIIIDLNKSSDFLNKTIKNILFYRYHIYREYTKFKKYYIRYFYNKNKLESITYFNYSGYWHREDGPAYIQYYDNGKIYRKEYCLNGKGHKEDGPALILYYENGNILHKSYWFK